MENAKLEERFKYFRERAKRVWLQDLIDEGVDTAISFSEFAPEFEVVLAYEGDTPGYPKGFIAVNDNEYSLIIGNQEYTAATQEDLIGLERTLFEWMASEEMIRT